VSGELAGRVIAITGCTGGLGRAIALAAARDGAELVLLGRNVRKLQGLHAELEQFASGRALMAPLDLEKSVANDYDRIAAAVEEHYGRLDGLVHCAALLGTLTPIEHYEVPTWARVMQVNLTAAFALTQVLLPALRRSADASIIFTSSSVGRKGKAYWD
jgi:NAD(P)-dependent dehydrogenase (short-subunit alcohol dehydrogenase family)